MSQFVKPSGQVFQAYVALTRLVADVHRPSFFDWSNKETGEPLLADHRNCYEVELWSPDGQPAEEEAGRDCTCPVWGVPDA